MSYNNQINNNIIHNGEVTNTTFWPIRTGHPAWSVRGLPDPVLSRFSQYKALPMKLITLYNMALQKTDLPLVGHWCWAMETLWLHQLLLHSSRTTWWIVCHWECSHCLHPHQHGYCWNSQHGAHNDHQCCRILFAGFLHKSYPDQLDFLKWKNWYSLFNKQTH